MAVDEEPMNGGRGDINCCRWTVPLSYGGTNRIILYDSSIIQIIINLFTLYFLILWERCLPLSHKLKPDLAGISQDQSSKRISA